MPKPEEIIRGGAIDGVGEYSESGIEQADWDRPDVMTAGALRFWQAKADEGQTVVYAISQRHARNLAAVFNDAGIPAALMLSDTLPNERAEAIESFGKGTPRVLVNLAVATEGFDLLDVSCVVVPRPTMSLVLCLQMVGRGLRPKPNGANCFVLDLAGNAKLHCLPEHERQWSLLPRGYNPGGDAPVILCENCDDVSLATSHFCAFCHAAFGKDCLRCGRRRATERWSYEIRCGQQHELVCDLCHYDAHIQAKSPVTDELQRLTEMEPDLDAALRTLLREERRRAVEADEERKRELGSPLSNRESLLADEDSLDQAFEQHLSTIPPEEPPLRNWPQMVQLYEDWIDGLNGDLADWKAEQDKLESKVPGGRLIYNNARERVLQALEAQAQQAGLLPQTRPIRHSLESGDTPFAEISAPASSDMDGWKSFVQLGKWENNDPNKGAGVKPMRLREPNGKNVPVWSWPDLLFQTSEYPVNEGLTVKERCLITTGGGKRYLIKSVSVDSKGNEFHGAKKLSNDLYIKCNLSAKDVARTCEQGWPNSAKTRPSSKYCWAEFRGSGSWVDPALPIPG